MTFGRKQIFTNAQSVTLENVQEVVDKALLIHSKNARQIRELRAYAKGDQPILNRTKEIRPEICNKTVVNYANWIVNFKVGYFLGEPIQYVSAESDAMPSETVIRLNKVMSAESKDELDKELAEDQFTVGTSYRLVLSGDSESPVNLYTLDPESTFVIYSSGIGNKPLAGVYITEDEQGKIFNVYTDSSLYVIRNGDVEEKPHTYGMIPIIEYPANRSRLGVFEPCIPILNSINNLESNRLDSVEQFVQSLLVLVNCTLDGKTANDVRQSGLIELTSNGENKASITEIAEVLDQQQNQTLKDDLFQSLITIAGMPSQTDGNTSDSSNNGAVILRNGWKSAEAMAKDSETIFRKSERQMLKLVSKIFRETLGIELNVSDIAIKFTRRNYEDILSKANVLTQLLGSDKVAPIDAFTACGMFPDPEEACTRGLDWYRETENQNETGAAGERA